MFLDVEVRRVDCRACGHVRQERLEWLADHPFYTERFAFLVGRRCRESTVQAVAKALRLDWEAVKALDVQCMTEQLRRVGTPGPRVIGIDDVSVGRGHSYRIVVSDLLRRRAIWFGGTGRTEADLDLFVRWLGPRKCRGIRLALMGTWPATLRGGEQLPFSTAARPPGGH